MDPQVVIAAPAPLTPAAYRCLAPALGADAVYVVAELLEQLAHIWRLEGEGVEGWAITRLENTPAGPEWVIIAGAGRGAAAAIPALCGLGQAHGAASVRAHAIRRGMTRMLTSAGFSAAGHDDDGAPVFRRYLDARGLH